MLLPSVQRHLVLQVQKVGKLQEVDESVSVEVAVVHHVVQDGLAGDHVKVTAHFLQVLLVDAPFAFLGDKIAFVVRASALLRFSINPSHGPSGYQITSWFMEIVRISFYTYCMDF